MAELYPHPFKSLENEFLRIDYLTSLGPRIIGLYARGVEGNLFAVTPDAHWPTPHGEYYMHGGHRLWTAPEDTYFMPPEDRIEIFSENNTVALRSGVDASGLEKEIMFQLEENRVVLNHRVTWHGSEPIELAPWALTQMRLGGMAILPHSKEQTGLLPNRNLVLWPYSRLRDERLDLSDEWILIHGRPDKEALKVGNFNPHGWVAYALEQVLFVKRFLPDADQKYPDLGCNAETYVRDAFLELETLGALRTLHPNDSMNHEETWEVSIGDYPATIETVRRIREQYS